jgi:hypothetical protein
MKLSKNLRIGIVTILILSVLSFNALADLYLNSRTGNINLNTTGQTRLQITPGGNLNLIGLVNVSIPGNLSVGGNVSVDGSTLFIDSENNRVGVGTANPFKILEVHEGTDENIVFRRGNEITGGNGVGMQALNDAHDTAVNFTIQGNHVFISGSGNNDLTINPSGNIGIGTTSPSTLLDVAGVVKSETSGVMNQGFIINNTHANANGISWGLTQFNGGALSVQINASSSSAGSKFLIDTDGNIGIGTTAPGEKIQVNGNALLTAAQPELKFKRSTADGTSAAVIAFEASDATRKWIIGSQQMVAGSNFEINEGNNANNRFTILTGGNVGIGTTGPPEMLSVNKTGIVAGFGYQGTGSNRIILGAEINGTMTGSESDTGVIGYGPTVAGGSGRNLVFAAYTGSSWPEIMRLQSDGNVGIGTTSPGTRLQVDTSGGAAGQVNYHIRMGRGTAVAGDIGTTRAAATNDVSAINFRIGGSELMRIEDDGNVGIGVTAPRTLLSLNETDNADMLDLYADTAESYTGTQLIIKNERASNTGFVFLSALSDADGTPDTEHSLRGDGTPLSDNAASTPADVAEWTRIVGNYSDYEFGDLVMFAVDYERKAAKATKENNELLMGAVTLKPGLVGVSYDIGLDVTETWGNKTYLELEKELNAKMITTIGYTPLKLSTENGAIKPGDPITSSSIPGIGMKSLPGNKIVGYAFESFDPGNGKMATHDTDLPTPIDDKPFRPMTKQITLPNGSKVWQGWVFSYVNLGYAKSNDDNELQKQINELKLNNENIKNSLDLLNQKVQTLEADLQ